MGRISEPFRPYSAFVSHRGWLACSVRRPEVMSQASAESGKRLSPRHGPNAHFAHTVAELSPRAYRPHRLSFRRALTRACATACRSSLRAACWRLHRLVPAWAASARGPSRAAWGRLSRSRPRTRRVLRCARSGGCSEMRALVGASIPAFISCASFVDALVGRRCRSAFLPQRCVLVSCVPCPRPFPTPLLVRIR